MPALTRRHLLRLAAAAGAELLLAGGAGYLYASRLEPGWLAVEEFDLRLPRLPAGLDGLQLAQLSDLHAGFDLPPDLLGRAMQRVAALAPDLLLVTGDWVTYDAGDAVAAARAVAGWQPPLGIYAVLGNHDHWTDAETVAEAITAAGITLLRNQHAAIPVGDATLWLAGVDDVWEGQADLSAALAGIPAGEPVVLLAHEPDYADQVATAGGVALQLSGHSHGGQVDLPLLGPPATPYLGRKYPRGLYRPAENFWLHTNRGLGLVRPAVRLNCRPELTLITLRA